MKQSHIAVSASVCFFLLLFLDGRSVRDKKDESQKLSSHRPSFIRPVYKRGWIEPDKQPKGATPIALPLLPDGSYVCQESTVIEGDADVALANGKMSETGFTNDGCMSECTKNPRCKAYIYGDQNTYCELWSKSGPTTAWVGARVCLKVATDSKVFKSSWNSISTDESCDEITGMLLAGEISGNSPLEGIVIGHPSNMGKNGLGDRIKAITGMALLAMAMERPLRVSLKENVWDFEFALENPYGNRLPWNHPWKRFFERKKAANVGDFRKKPSDKVIEQHISSNATMFYGALGGDRVVDGKWLENFMARKKKGPAIPGSWAKNYERCVARTLFKPSAVVMTQLESDITAATSQAVLGKLYGDNPETLLLGLHARYSGKAVESHAKRRLDPAAVQAQISCSWNMTMEWVRTALVVAKGRTVHAVWLIASDQPDDFFKKAKAFIAHNTASVSDGMVHVAHATVGKAKHVKHDTSKDSILRLWLDWFLLSESATCSYGRSGFPETACAASERRFLSDGRVQQGAKGGCSSWKLK